VRAGLAGLVAVAGVFVASSARAEPPYVERHVVLPEHYWAFDFGVGIGHDGNPQRNPPTGVGLNFDMAVSPVDRLELGFRSGLRIGDDGRTTQADTYGRLFDHPTFGTGGYPPGGFRYDDFANPELRIRGALYRGPVAEVALEGRLFLPAEHGSEAGLMFGVPLLFHIAHIARLDTGLYVPFVFYNPIVADIFVPVNLWFQPISRLWVGPMTGVDYHTNTNDADVSFGVGLGVQVARFCDLKTQVLFPALNQTQGAQTVGVGFGVELRIE
jgi:hypothetical protein